MSYRSDFRGRRIYGGSQVTRRHTHASVPTAVEPPYGPELRRIVLNELAKRGNESNNYIQIESCRTVGSYSWMSNSNPSILVPGIPPRWTPIATPVTLNQDRGTFYRDKNACRSPDHPMEAAIVSILEAAKHKNCSLPDDIDLVACSSTLGNLLRYCSNDPKPFRMIVYKAGDTVHFVRREKSPRDIIPDVKGYGHTFPDAFTTWDRCVSGSESHQRIISYRLAGLKCLVRFEADGYLPMKNRVAIPSTSSSRSQHIPDIDEITSTLWESTKLAQNEPYSAGPITASSAGVQVDQHSLFDLKTRSIKCKDIADDILASEIPRLWIKQVPNFILAFHSRGTFDDVQVKDVKRELAGWEKENQRELSHFSTLLATIIDIARKTDEVLEVCLTDDHPDLQVWHQSGSLPELCSATIGLEWAAFLENIKSTGVREKEDKAYEKENTTESSEIAPCDKTGSDPSAGPLTYGSVCDDECGYCGKCV